MRVPTPVRVIAVLAALLVSAGARAVPLVQVSYHFDSTNSVLAVTSPISVSLPPQGTFSGDILVTFTSNDQADILDGPATLDSFDLDASLNVSANLFGAFTLTGPASVALVDPADGVLNGTQLGFGGASGDFHASGTVTCTGTPCGIVSLPSGLPTVFDQVAAVVLPTLTVGSLSGTISNLNFGFAGISANLTFAAAETGRAIVPEPSTGLLLAVGVAGLARRRRRVSDQSSSANSAPRTRVA